MITQILNTIFYTGIITIVILPFFYVKTLKDLLSLFCAYARLFAFILLLVTGLIVSAVIGQKINIFIGIGATLLTFYTMLRWADSFKIHD